MDEKDFELAVKLRGRSFARNLATYRLLTKLQTPQEKDNLSGGRTFNVAVMNVGAPAGGMKIPFIPAWSRRLHNNLLIPGMNAAVRSFVRMGLYHHCNVYGIYSSFDGLAEGKLKVCLQNLFHNLGGFLENGMGRRHQLGYARRIVPRHAGTWTMQLITELILLVAEAAADQIRQDRSSAGGVQDQRAPHHRRI